MGAGIRLTTLLLVAAIALAVSGCGVEAPPAARGGTLDLSGWDFAARGPAALDGEWEFYWQQRLEPGDFAPQTAVPHAATGMLRVPGAWNGFAVGETQLPGTGYATYRLRVHLPETAGVMGIYVHYMSTSYTLWVDGARVAAGGVVGADKATTTPQFLPRVAYFTPQSPTVEIIAQVANFDHRVGGVWNRLYLGTGDQMAERMASKLAFAQLLFGAMLIMALYHLGLFALRPAERSALYFGLFCLTIAIRLLVSGEFFLVRLLPDFPWHLHLKIEYLTGYLAPPFFYLFVRTLYPNEVPRWAVGGVVAVAGGLGLASLLLSVYAASLVVIPYQAILLLMVAYIGWALVRAALGRREGSGLFLAGGGFFLLTVVHDLLSYNQIWVTGRLIPVGLFVLILAQSTVLAKRFAVAFKRQQVLSRENDALLQNLRQHLVEIQHSRRLLTAREENLRKGIAEMLHGSVQTKLLMAENQLAEAARRGGADRATAELLANAQATINQVREEDVRQASHLLHPTIIQIGLVAAARQLAHRFEKYFAVDLQVDPRLEELDDPALGAIPELVRLAIYRVLEEALGNVYSHAAAGRVTITLGITPAGMIDLQVQDDGKGCDRARLQPGLGLRTIAARVQEMGGAWSISSAPDKGTTVTVSVPLLGGDGAGLSPADSPADRSAPS